MILAITISFSSIWIPIVLTIIAFILGLHILNDADHGYFGGDIVQAIGGMLLIIGIPFIWTSYFTVLYFLI